MNYLYFLGIELSMNPQPATDRRQPISGNLSSLDLDIWGGETTTPVLIPRSPAECVAAVDGRCPPGCNGCEQFRQEWEEGSLPTARGLEKRSPEV
jgi:hypothetical protein